MSRATGNQSFQGDPPSERQQMSRQLKTRHDIHEVQKLRNSAAVKLVTNASQWRKIETRRRTKKGRGALYLRIASFPGNAERQSFMHYRYVSPILKIPKRWLLSFSKYYYL
ncbi:hypothetical protein EVAR_67416_1 [Eumeta japonica]|uniref:Uncharacterized protein n=1 Tax=Eumeta variegata TaxID=151549 RepID=A0A4C2A752_EUMVA|nr:hypothetical protein EVAR_67416_1 [Eumeta japonica]